VATASAVGKPRSTWHSRATWSARDDRKAFIVWLALLWTGILAGFGVDFSRFLQEAPPEPRVVDLHAVVFTVWMLLLTTQVLLVVGNRVALHRKLGWFVVGWAGFMAIMGPWAAFASQTLVLHGPEYDPPFLSIQLGGITEFLILLAWGISLRKNPAAHKRIMILSTVALVDAGFNRFAIWIWPAMPQSLLVWYVWAYYGNMLIIVAMASWDWWRGRLMKQFALGALGLLAAEGLEDLLYHWGPWKVLTTSLIAAWARHFR
jgi:hypothetical protein